MIFVVGSGQEWVAGGPATTVTRLTLLTVARPSSHTKHIS